MKLSPELRKELQRSLVTLAKEVSSPLILLTDMNGTPLGYLGDKKFLRGGILPVLISSSFAANLEICSYAAENGEHSNPSLLLEGDTLNIYIGLIEHPLVLSILFPTEITVGHVQMSTRKLFDQAKTWRQLLPQPVTPQRQDKGWSDALRATEREIETLFQKEKQKDYLLKEKLG